MTDTNFITLSFLACFLVLVAAGEPVHSATIPAERLTVTVPDTVVVNSSDTTAFNLSLTLDSGWHVNSNDPVQSYLIPTTLTLDSSSMLETVEYPRGKLYSFSFSRERILVYTGTTQLKVVLRGSNDPPVKPGKRSFKLTFQPCSNRQCLRPRDLQVPFLVKKLDTKQAIELDFRKKAIEADHPLSESSPASRS